MVFKKIIFQNRYVALETPSRPLPFMANTILNFHFDYLHPSLKHWTNGQKEGKRSWSSNINADHVFERCRHFQSFRSGKIFTRVCDISSARTLLATDQPMILVRDSEKVFERLAIAIAKGPFLQAAESRWGKRGDGREWWLQSTTLSNTTNIKLQTKKQNKISEPPLVIWKRRRQQRMGQITFSGKKSGPENNGVHHLKTLNDNNRTHRISLR